MWLILIVTAMNTILKVTSKMMCRRQRHLVLVIKITDWRMKSLRPRMLPRDPQRRGWLPVCTFRMWWNLKRCDLVRRARSVVPCHERRYQDFYPLLLSLCVLATLRWAASSTPQTLPPWFTVQPQPEAISPNQLFLLINCLSQALRYTDGNRGIRFPK